MRNLGTLVVVMMAAAAGCGDDDPPPPPNMVLIPAGTFTMGSPTNEPGRDSQETQHQVTLTKAFHVSITEVTQSEWQSVMGWNESHFPGANRPVEQVTWYDCVSYCNKRSMRDWYPLAYTISNAIYDGNHITSATVTWNQSANGYRLLTEAEWEYACRATSQTAFCSGGITNAEYDCWPTDQTLDLIGWYCGNANDATHDVGLKAANAWGLKDMHGNLYEWCWDRPGDYPTGAVTDPSGPASGTSRRYRGGSWYRYAVYCRSAYQQSRNANYRHYEIGFRVARTAR